MALKVVVFSHSNIWGGIMSNEFIILEKIQKITGTITLETGLHIGGASETIEIGGLDNPVIKDPRTGAPYIPGSSLKGKIRSLLEIKYGKIGPKGNPCDCGRRDCPVCPMFGTTPIDDKAKKNIDPALAKKGPTRIIFRDAFLTPHWLEKFKAGDFELEVKYENSINRISGSANPRPLERVPAGISFHFAMSLKVFQGDEQWPYITYLKRGMKLLEQDALGGAGSRGCGQIVFHDFEVDGIKEPSFLESVDF